MTSQHVIDELRRRQQERSYARHPFVVDMITGKAPLHAIGGWVLQQGHLAYGANEMIGLFALRIPNFEMKKALYANLTGEVLGIRGIDPHWKLARRMAVACGWSAEAAEAEPLLPETRAFCTFIIAEAFLRSAEAALIVGTVAGEQTFGDVSPKISKSMRENYGLDRHAAEYVSEHEEADIEHAEAGWHMVNAYCRDDERCREVLSLYDVMMQIWWEYYDGVVRAYVQGKKPGFHSRV